jgi:hypothetical protein
LVAALMLAVTSVTLVATLGSGLEEVAASAGCTSGPPAAENTAIVDIASKTASTLTDMNLTSVAIDEAAPSLNMLPPYTNSLLFAVQFVFSWFVQYTKRKPDEAPVGAAIVVARIGNDTLFVAALLHLNARVEMIASADLYWLVLSGQYER